MASVHTTQLGDLERAIMDQLWDASHALTAYDLQESFSDRKLAVTTILTVLGRLERKELVTAERSSRPHHYTPVADRAEYMAVLMNQVLGAQTDRQAVLERFVGMVAPADAELLRQILASAD